MKFNTITYDANLPTVQQVNVPTNSDYKVGMKVKRNGSVQSIKPSEFTVYTGEINVIPPTDFNGAAVSVANASQNIIVIYAPDVTEALNGKVVKAKDLRFEASYNSGATWEEVAPLGFVSQLKINDKSAGTNNFVAQMDPRVPKWHIISDGQVVGEAPEITMPQSTLQVQFVTISSGWGFKSFPCQFRVIIPYGGYEEKVTYPVDSEKTNGYVTITKASGDDASFKQFDVRVESGHITEFGPEQAPTLQKKATSGTSRLNFTTDISSIAGQNLYANNIILEASVDEGATWLPIEMDQSINYFRPAFSTTDNVIAVWKNGKLYEQMTDTGEPLGAELEYITIPSNCYFTSNSARGAAYLVPSFPAMIRWRFMVGDPVWNADFKLNINEFKSQSGDIAETLADGSSVKVDGTYADGTTFSYDFCIK